MNIGIGIQIMLPQLFYQHSKSLDFIAQSWWVANVFNERTSHYIDFQSGIFLAVAMHS